MLLPLFLFGQMNLYNNSAYFNSDGYFQPIAVVGKMVEANEAGSDITCTTAGSYYQWVTMDSTHSFDGSQGIVYDHTAHDLTVPIAGRYLISAAVSITCDASQTVHMALYKNGNIGPYGVVHYEFKFPNQEITMSLNQIPNLAANDYLDLRFMTDNNGDVIEVYHAVLSVVYVGRML